MHITSLPISVIPFGELHMLEIDPIANDNPMMLSSEFNLLVNDIKANGQKDPVLMYDGKIMDGRNRLAAAKQLIIDLKVIHLTGTREEAEASARSSDARRNLSKSQLAMKAARRVVNSRVNSDGTPAKRSQWLSPKKLNDVINKVIGERSVELAISYIKEYPEVANGVFEGHFPMSTAGKMIENYKMQQADAEYYLCNALEQKAYNADNYAPEAVYFDLNEHDIKETYSSSAVTQYREYLKREDVYPRQRLVKLLVAAEEEHKNCNMKQTAKMRSELDDIISE